MNVLNKLKKLTFNQYLSVFTALILVLNCAFVIKEGFDDFIIPFVISNLLSICFCIVYFLKDKFSRDEEKLVSKTLIVLLLIRWLSLALLLKTELLEILLAGGIIFLLFHLCTVLSLRNIKNINNTTIVLGIASIVAFMTVSSRYGYGFIDSFDGLIFFFGTFLLEILIFLVVCEIIIKKHYKDRENNTEAFEILKDLRELLDLEYITHEEYILMKEKIIDIYRV